MIPTDPRADAVAALRQRLADAVAAVLEETPGLADEDVAAVLGEFAARAEAPRTERDPLCHGSGDDFADFDLLDDSPEFRSRR